MRNYLHIDLTTGLIEEKSIDPSLARDFIGGSGLTARLKKNCEQSELQ